MPRKSSRVDERSRRILDAALSEFSTKGFHGASIDRIAEIAGVSKPTVYKRFSGKEDLFISIVTTAMESVVAPIASLLRTTGKRPARATLWQFTRECARTILSPEVLALWRLAVGETQRFPEVGARYYDSSHSIGIRAIADLLKHLEERGELRLSDPEAAADHFWSLVFERVHTYQVFHRVHEMPPAEIERRLQAGLDAFLTLYSAAPPAERLGAGRISPGSRSRPASAPAGLRPVERRTASR